MIDSLLDTVIHGDNLEVMRGMPDSCVDTVITDPPAGIAFMGKSWDKDKGGRDQWIAWLAEIMAECLRVTKPGGVLLCWSIPRTSHWTGMAIENGGWRIVDKIAHLFGSGFPKSLDVSKSLDELHFTKWLKANPEQAIEYRHDLKQAKQSGGDAVQDVIRKYKRMAGAYREVVGRSINKSGIGNATKGHRTVGGTVAEYTNITAPATALAKLWDGWGTALKPSREDWFVAYKPLDGTYAQNAERWGVAGLNIEGGRISHDGEESPSIKRRAAAAKSGKAGMDMDSSNRAKRGLPVFNKDLAGYIAGNPGEQLGRFPSNTILSCTCEGDHEPDCPVRMLDEQSDGASRFFKQIVVDTNDITMYNVSQKGGALCGNTTGNQKIVGMLNGAIKAVERCMEDAGRCVSGLNITGNYLKDVRCITKTLIQRMTELKILLLCLGDNTGFCMDGFDKTIEQLVDLNIDDASDAKNISHWKDSISVAREHIRAIARFAQKKLCGNGDPKTENTSIPTCENISSDSESAPTRFLYQSKSSRAERNAGCEGMEEKVKDSEYRQATGNAMVDRIHGCGKERQNHHPTVKPLALMEYLCNLTKTPTGGIVLDPFAGSGTTGLAAYRTGRRYILIEKEAEYAEIARARIQHEKDLMGLFPG